MFVGADIIRPLGGNMKKNVYVKEIFSGHNEKYNVDFKYVRAMFSGHTCEFEYEGKKYGFTVEEIEAALAEK